MKCIYRTIFILSHFSLLLVSWFVFFHCPLFPPPPPSLSLSGVSSGAQVQTCGTLAWVTCIEDMRSPYKPYPKTVRIQYSS